MMDQGMFQKHFMGRDGFIWWIGQVADENTWKSNITGFPVKSNKDEPGFGERYKVRILGYHTAVPSELNTRMFCIWILFRWRKCTTTCNYGLHGI